MLIAIDHGNKQVKTVHGNAIVSGVQKSKTRPYGRDILKYGGSYYTLSAQRIPDRKSTRLNSSHIEESRMPSSA